MHTGAPTGSPDQTICLLRLQQNYFEQAFVPLSYYVQYVVAAINPLGSLSYMEHPNLCLLPADVVPKDTQGPL